MNHEDCRLRLDAYVDGTLSEEELRQVGRHLADCDSCREEAERIKQLLGNLRALPRSVMPPRDLWPEISDGITAGLIAAGERDVVDMDEVRARRGRGKWWRYAVAASVLIAFSSAITAYLARKSPVADRGDLAVGKPFARPSVAAMTVEATYSGTILQLHRALAERRSGLSPEAVRIVERNLAIIDGAIRESQAALSAEPGDPELIRSVAAMYERKIALLEDANGLPDGS